MKYVKRIRSILIQASLRLQFPCATPKDKKEKQNSSWYGNCQMEDVLGSVPFASLCSTEDRGKLVYVVLSEDAKDPQEWNNLSRWKFYLNNQTHRLPHWNRRARIHCPPPHTPGFGIISWLLSYGRRNPFWKIFAIAISLWLVGNSILQFSSKPSTDDGSGRIIRHILDRIF